MRPLEAHAKIIRIYVEAVRRAYGQLLDRQDEAAALARLLISLGEATADGAEAIASTQAKLEAITAELGIKPPRPKLRLIDGG